MSSYIQTTNQLTSNTVIDQQQKQQQQSMKKIKANTVKTKVSKKLTSTSSSYESASETISTALETTLTASNIISSTITTPSTENISNSFNIFEKPTSSIISNNHISLESSVRNQSSNNILDSTKTKNQQNGFDFEPSHHGLQNVKTSKTKNSSSSANTSNGKKKVKKSNSEKENISVRDSYCNLVGLSSSPNFVSSKIEAMQNQKSSFSKFDALQKRNLIHVRSSDAGKAQEKFTDTSAEKKQDCRVCQKEVYKMEEIKAEKNVYHKNCFRCNECEKQLKVDNYQSHEGVLYCKAHFKSLFMPKVVEESVQDKPRKPELIIRENQPVELPPDVVRASDKPNLGLEELQQINIRSKFEAFEKSHVKNEDKGIETIPSLTGVKRSASILSKLAKFQSKCNAVSVKENNSDIQPFDEQSESETESSNVEDTESDLDLVKAKRSQRERPVGLGNMNDIKSKFETGHIMSKEERREERKQEIQNIRSRLFMGKQARIKEMYQQAVAESEHGITSVGKKSEIEIGDNARCLKEKFEKGEIFKDYEETAKVPEEELEVFESAISKRSRSLFQELDASAARNQLSLGKRSSSNESSFRNRSVDDQNWINSNSVDSIVKHDEKIDDIQIKTSDISSKFKFFETYKPVENEKKTFRITPPRDGVVKFPNSDSDDEIPNIQSTVDIEPLQKSHTTKMLNKFRELEQTKNNNKTHLEPRPLKCFTPPPDDNRRIFIETESDVESMSEEDDEEEQEDGEDYDEESDEEEDSDYNGIRSRHHLEDEALIQAQAAARAKQLRAKFEKWEANEIQREIQDGTINLYEDTSEDNQIESAKSIRERFENMKCSETNQPARPRYKVNRFV